MPFRKKNTPLWLIILVIVLTVGGIFGIWEAIELTFLKSERLGLRDTELWTLWYLHIIRGTSTSLMVSILGISFVVRERRDRVKMLEVWNKELERKVKETVEALLLSEEKLRRSRLLTIYLLAAACEARDTDTGDHIHRIRFYSEALAREMGLPETLIYDISHFSTLHDIGKVHIPDKILLKRDKLSEEEWEVMKTHTVHGERILGSGEEFRIGREIIRWHHENWDGSGYPDGLKGEDIPISARVVRTVDILDALLMSRPYRPLPLPFEDAGKTIVLMKGKELDPVAVSAFERLWQQNIFLKIKENLPLLQLGIHPIQIPSPGKESTA